MFPTFFSLGFLESIRVSALVPPHSAPLKKTHLQNNKNYTISAHSSRNTFKITTTLAHIPGVFVNFTLLSGLALVLQMTLKDARSLFSFRVTWDVLRKNPLHPSQVIAL